MNASLRPPISAVERLPSQRTSQRVRGTIAATWGIGGLLLLLGYALARLVPIASEIRDYPLHWPHWSLLIVNVVLMAYLEGYRGFQKGLAPRIAARARELAQRPSIVSVVLAPAYCYGLFHAPGRQILARAALITMIVLFVVAARTLDAPWRGLVDVGVIIGLSWGVVAIGLHGWRALSEPW